MNRLAQRTVRPGDASVKVDDRFGGICFELDAAESDHDEAGARGASNNNSKRSTMNDCLTHLDLFSGIGGFSLAFQAAGFATIAHAEIEPAACRLLAKNYPDIPNLGDVRKLCRRGYDCGPGDNMGYCHCPRCDEDFGDCACIGTDQFTDTYGFPTVITGGFPCQDISVAHNCGGEGKYDRKNKGLAGARSGLWWEFHRIICELHPVFVLIENVPNLRTQGADEIRDAMERAGYACEPFVVGAWAVGADHGRDRVWFVAHDKGVRIQGLRSPGQQVTHSLAPALLPLRNSDGQWEVEPDLRRTANGVPGWVDRVRCCGNAIVPQVAFYFAKAMKLALTQAL